MGNRAVVKFGDDVHGVYLHWNGGPESVLAFLEVMRQRGWLRMDYASARFAAVVVEFFDAEGDCDGNSVGIFDDAAESGAHVGDNGLYAVTLVISEDRKSYHWLVNQNGKRCRAKPNMGIVGALQKWRETRQALAAGLKKAAAQ